MSSEEKYMKLALEKTECVYIVCEYESNGENSRSRLISISPNAALYGMNVDALKSGVRLIMDYVHPDDRKELHDAIRLAGKMKKDFTYAVRFVGDDLKSHNINLQVAFLDQVDDKVIVEYIVRKEKALETPNAPEDVTLPKQKLKKIDIRENFFEESGIHEIAKQFASLCGVYSVILDINGNMLTEPTGPKSYFGQFYSMITNPSYQEPYENLKICCMESKAAFFSEINDGVEESRVAAAPIYIGNVYFATWLLYAYTPLQAKNLFKEYQRQFQVAQGFSKVITQLYLSDGATESQSAMQKALDFEIQQKAIISELLSNMHRDTEAAFDQAFDAVGRLLKLDYIVYYASMPGVEDIMELRNFWCKNSDRDEARKIFGWNHDHFNPEIKKQIRTEGLCVDQDSMTNRLRVEVFKGNARAVMVFPIMLHDEYMGRLVFIENTNERTWSDSEKEFAKEITRLFSQGLMMREPKGSINAFSDQAEELLEGFPGDVFVRSQNSGKVLYMNSSFREKIGCDMIGEDSGRIIPNVQDKFEGLGVSVSDEKKTPSRYRRYINVLYGNYDITEIKTRWDDGEPADILVIMPAK